MKARLLAVSCILSCSQFMLTACSSNQESQFVSQCMPKVNNKQSCQCTYDLAKKSLDNDDQFDLFTATIFEDNSKRAEIQATMGFMDLAKAGTKIAWLLANLDAACQVNKQQ